MSIAGLFRRVRFSLRAVFAAVTLFGIALGLWLQSAQRQKAARAELLQIADNNQLWYDYEVGGADLLDSLADFEGARFDFDGGSWAPAALRTQLGDDFFHNIASVRLFGDDTKRCVDALVRLPRLRHITFFDDHSVDDEDMARLANLRELQSIEIYICESVGDDSLRSFARLPRLRALKIGYVTQSQITDDGMAQFKRMRQLQALTLRGDRITDRGLAELADLGELQVLQLDCPQVTGKGFAALSGLTKLRWLVPGATICDDDMKYFADYADLEALDMTRAKMTGTGFKNLSHLNKLTWLDLCGAGITDEAMIYLARMPDLDAINLQGTQVTVAGLETLRGSKTLRRLYVDPSLGPGVARLRQLMPQCSIDFSRSSFWR